MLNISSTLKTMKPLAAVQKRKKELYKQYEKEIAAGDVVTMSKIENELLALAKEELKDDPGFQSYLSGNINFANNYKSNELCFIITNIRIRIGNQKLNNVFQIISKYILVAFPLLSNCALLSLTFFSVFSNAKYSFSSFIFFG